MKSFKIFSLLLLAGVTVSSCSKSLDLKPIDQVVEENAFLDVPSLERGLLGAYQTFNQRTTTDYGAYGYHIWASAVYSDEATMPTENNTGRGAIPYRWQVDPSTTDVTNTWAAYYFGINRANRVLAAAEKITTNNAADEATKNKVMGEALALRAFGHLQLLINFANSFEPNALGVPYVKVAETFGKPARNTVAEVITNIHADLEAAKALIPGSFTSATRISLPAIHAIQARTALYGKDWDLAIAAATAAINAVPLATKAQYPQIWTDKTNAEVIWKFRREQANFTRIGDWFYDRTNNRIIFGPSKELRDAFNKTSDIRYAATVLERGPDRYSVGKYLGGDASSPSLADLKVFRTAEMYLIRAEANAEKGLLISAAEDLNTLRAVRINGYVPQVFLTKEALINAILEERFKELAFEGHRIHDLRRKGLAVTRLAEDAVNAQGAVLLQPTDKQYYFPIPDEEILANENIEQNPGYLK